MNFFHFIFIYLFIAGSAFGQDFQKKIPENEVSQYLVLIRIKNGKVMDTLFSQKKLFEREFPTFNRKYSGVLLKFQDQKLVFCSELNKGKINGVFIFLNRDGSISSKGYIYKKVAIFI
mgnify:FL=1